MFTVKLYINTGFNAVNIPESPKILEAAADSTLELPSIDIYQEYQINTVSVRVTTSNKSKAILADYIQINDAYYAVTGYTFTSVDILQISLYFEALLSARALGAVESIGGMTIRRRPTSDEDTLGAFIDDDELLAPMNKLVLDVGDPLWTWDDKDDNGAVYSNYQLVESLADLTSAGTDHMAQTYTDSDSGSTVTIPVISSITPAKETVFTVQSRGLPNRGTALYHRSLVTDGISRCRSLGYESAILKSFTIPGQFVDITDYALDSKLVHQVTGKITQKTSSVYNINYATVRNKRVLYGIANTMGFITVGGSKLESKPEELATSFDDTVSITEVTDPRPDGAPYFRFTRYNNSDDANFFWANAVRGEDWTESPLRYRQAAGGYQLVNDFNFTVDKDRELYNIADANRNRSIGQSIIGTAVDTSTGIFDAILNFASGKKDSDKGVINSSIKTASSGLLGVYNQSVEQQNAYKEYVLNRNSELVNLGNGLRQLSFPSIQFVANSQIIRDYIGNGVIPYRYRYSDSDVERIDTLLTMYGYKMTMPFKAAMLLEHSDFEYLQLSNVSVIASTIPMWWRDKIASELNSGIRVWHVKPNFGYYTGEKTVEA